MPAEAAILKPVSTIGNVQGKSVSNSPVAAPEYTISTNPRAVSATTISFWAGIQQPESFISRFGIQGSGAQWKLRPGRYEIVWQFETVETDGDDSFLIWNGERTSAIASSNIAQIRSGTRFVSYWQRTKVTTRSGDLALIAVDTRDRFRTSSIKLYDLKRSPEPSAIAGLVVLGLMYKWVRRRH
jgi:hypothetical protein